MLQGRRMAAVIAQGISVVRPGAEAIPAIHPVREVFSMALAIRVTAEETDAVGIDQRDNRHRQ
ncbi:MAG: hypothetical protein U9Q81_16250 [Pseudomonadota bacterium]|nr:hypothetical protein [Pseudomonadota bacterium]